MAKPLIAVETIYQKAIDLLDREGIDGLSARRLAAALNCSPRTLYQQVGKRDEMIGRILSYYFQRLDLDFQQRDSWQESAYEWATAMRRSLLAHPNLSRLLTTDQRHVIVDYVNELLRVLLREGFPMELALRTCRVLAHQVISLSLTEIETPPIAIRRRKRSKKEIAFEDLVIASQTGNKKKAFQDQPEVFNSAIQFTLQGIEQTLLNLQNSTTPGIQIISTQKSADK